MVALALVQITEHVLQLAGHFLHSWGRHDFYADVDLFQLDFNFFFVELALAQFFAKHLPRTRLL